MFEHICAAVPDPAGARDEAYQAGLLATVRAVLDHSFRAMENGPDWAEAVPPEAAVQARRAARTGVSLGAVLRRYVAGHRKLSEMVAEEIERAGLSSSTSELQEMHRTQEKLLEQLTAVVEFEYDQERRRTVRSPEQRRLESIRRLLADQTSGQREVEMLNYRFDAWHIGVIASGIYPKQALESLSKGRELLSVTYTDETAWGWVGSRHKPSLAAVDEMRLDDEHSTTVLSIGEPAQGMTGWRRTHRQALLALHVALLGKQTVTRYADVALLAPWIQDPDQGVELVELYLSPLASEKDQGVVSRQTLRAYLEADRNVSSAARNLGIDRRTLSYRLCAIEERLGYNLSRRKAELEVALRLHELLPPDGMHIPVQDAALDFPTLA